ncbi:MAG: hypothetical protein ACRCZS_20905 [Chroococcidiopsis sp.]
MSKPKNRLSTIEQRDRTRLEQVARDRIKAAQSELAKIEKLGLWRSSHRTFGDYCQERFGFNPIDLDVESLMRLLESAR